MNTRVCRPLVLVGSLLMGTAAAGDDCAVIDAWSQMIDSDHRLHSILSSDTDDYSWLKSAKTCTLGQYTVWAPTDGSSNHIWVFLDDWPYIQKSPDQLLIYEASRKLVATLRDDNRNGEYDAVTYVPRPQAAGEAAELWDSDRDGCPDIKLVDESNESRRRFVKLAGRWCELVGRDGKWGYVVDGKFHEMGEAQRAAIEATLDECVLRDGAPTAK